MSDLAMGAVIGWLLAAVGVLITLLGADGAINMAVGSAVAALLFTLAAIAERISEKRH